MVMTKTDAVKYILANMKESDARQLFRQSLSLATLTQLAVRLGKEGNITLKKLLGNELYALVVIEAEENKELMSEYGHLAAVGEVVSIFEQMQSSGFIEFTFPEQEDKDEKQNNIHRVLSFLDMARSL